jgi:hypothetical protein
MTLLSIEVSHGGRVLAGLASVVLVLVVARRGRPLARWIAPRCDHRASMNAAIYCG